LIMQLSPQEGTKLRRSHSNSSYRRHRLVRESPPAFWTTFDARPKVVTADHAISWLHPIEAADRPKQWQDSRQ
jgi:hypothetical protein